MVGVAGTRCGAMASTRGRGSSEVEVGKSWVPVGFRSCDNEKWDEHVWELSIDHGVSMHGLSGVSAADMFEAGRVTEGFRL